MYRRIFVPVDGSDASTLGRVHAIGLAQTQGARVRFMNVVDDSVGEGGIGIAMNMSALRRSLQDRGERALEEAASLARSKNLKVETSLLHSQGRRHVSDVILDEANKWRADLIVMGTHGKRGLNRLLLGSDAERVLRDTPVPLLLVREGSTKTAVKKRVGKTRQGSKRLSERRLPK